MRRFPRRSPPRGIDLSEPAPYTVVSVRGHPLISPILAVLLLAGSCFPARADGVDDLVRQARANASRQNSVPSSVETPLQGYSSRGICADWQTMCLFFGESQTRAFTASYRADTASLAADNPVVRGMFSSQDSRFFQQVFSDLPVEQWRFVVSLQHARRAIVANMGTGNVFKNTAAAVTGGRVCDGTRCYERDETVAASVKAQPDRKSWKRFTLSSHTNTVSEHNASCYAYSSGTNPVELAVDSWKDVVADPKQWWQSNDSEAYEGLTRHCGGKQYCGECACLYASYRTLKAWKTDVSRLRSFYDIICPDSGAGFSASEAKLGGAMRQEFGFPPSTQL